MDRINDAYADARRQETEFVAARDAAVAAAERVARLRDARAAQTRTADPRDPVLAQRLIELDAEIAAAERERDVAREHAATLRRRRRIASDRFGRLVDPRKEISRLDGETPLLLLPVRMETRFVDDELWVRVYPDQWAVDAFDERLADGEIDSARTFWTGWWRAGGDEDRRRAAWRGLVGSHGSGRGGWITRQYRPLNPGDEPVRTDPDEVILVVASHDPLPADVRVDAGAFWEAIWRANGNAEAVKIAREALVAAAGEEGAAAIEAQPPANLDEPAPDDDRSAATVAVGFLDLPAPDAAATTRTPWTRPAQAQVLPDCFVLLGFQGRTLVMEAVGNPVPPTLVVGPDPAAGAGDQLRIDNGDLIVPDELRWMFDFDEAIAVGMGFRISLTDQTRGGFDRLFAVGLRVAAKPEESQHELEQLLTHHLCSRTGFALVPQGTPTNNTEQAGAGFDRADDADASYARWLGGGSGLADRDDWASKQDGQWLAEALGIDPALLATVPGAAGTDQVEARAANVALWPATAGYFLDTMLHPICGDRTVELVRAFFTDYVSGRGLVPAIRIGRQPYGILPTTVFSRLQPFSAGDRDPLETPFLQALNNVVGLIAGEWEALAANVPHAGDGGDPHQTLLDVLGMHPASVEFHQRYAESIEDLYNRLTFDGLGAVFVELLQAIGGIERARALLRNLGWRGTDPDILEKLFHGAQHRLKGPLIDDRPLSETDPVRAYTDDGRNYLLWLVDAASTSLETLRRQQGFSDNRRPTALLYLLLRHSLLLEWWDTSLRFRLDVGVIDEAGLQRARQERPFIHVRPNGDSESRFQALYAAEPLVTGDDRTPVAEVIPHRLFEFPARHLAETIEAIKVLIDVPTARLERVLAEHLDCCSHRLDAWRLGFAHHRLLGMRGVADGDPAEPKRGMHLGAYGWLEAVHPEPRPLEPVRLPGPLADAFADRPAGAPADPPLFRDPTNGGFVHAPSLNHAATAAILRSGYLANVTPAQPGVMAVNLSSERMRLAMSIIQGVRHGQSLGLMLGYRLERGLHDRHGLAEVDRFIHELRRVFPAPGDRDGRQAIDGLDLVRHIHQSGMTTYPFGHPELMTVPASTAEATAINLEVERLLDAHDAVADLALAEGVHQTVLGNFDRAAATLDAYGKDGFPTEPAVLETPRTGTTITHRFGLHLRAGLSHTASPVPGLAMTPRATAEPAVNDFLARQLPAPVDVVARVSWTDRAGAIHDRLVSQAEVGLQPIDLLHVLHLGGQAMTELDERIVRLVETDAALPPDVLATVRIHYTDRVANRTTFFEVAPLVGHLRALVMRSRSLRPTDVVPSIEARRAIDDLAARASRDRPAAVLTALDLWRTTANDLIASLDVLLADPVANQGALVAGIDTFVDRTIAVLREAGGFGLPATGWGDIGDRRHELFGELMTLVAGVIARWLRRLDEVDAILAAEAALPSNASDEERNRLLLLAERVISTTRTDPMPASADDYLAAIMTKRDAFVATLADFQAARATAASVPGTFAAVQAILPVDAFDADPPDLTPTAARIVELATYLRSRVAATVAEATTRIAAATQHLAEHDATGAGQASVDAIVAATRALLGEDAVIVPEFVLPPPLADEWEAAMAHSRTGQLTAHLLATRPYAVDDWLHGLARVREKVHSWEQIVLLTGALGRAEPNLLPIQLPHANEPWLGLELPSGFTISGDRVLYTAHYPVAFVKTDPQCGLLVDEWTETIPGDAETTGIAFHHDSPGCEAPQAMLLAVPPQPTAEWRWDDVVDTLHETLDLARSRAIEPEHVDTTPFATFLPATVSSATVQGISIAVNLAVNNDVLRALGGE